MPIEINFDFTIVKFKLIVKFEKNLEIYNKVMKPDMTAIFNSKMNVRCINVKDEF